MARHKWRTASLFRRLDDRRGAADRDHGIRHHIAAPSSVNFTKVPLSCRQSQPCAMARAIPARKSLPLPPAARNGALTGSM